MKRNLIYFIADVFIENMKQKKKEQGGGTRASDPPESLPKRGP